MSETPENFAGKVIVNIILDALPGKGAELASLVVAIRDYAMSKPELGCLSYRVARSGDNVVVFEEFKDKEAVDVHLSLPQCDDLFNSKGTVLDTIDIAFYEEL